MVSTGKSFGSDNHAGVHPEVLDAIARANAGHQPAYGEDEETRRLERLVTEHFGEGARGYPVWGGTGANVLGLASLLRPYDAVICATTAHIHTDECGAPERVHGMKLLTVPTADGKLDCDNIASRLAGLGDQHHVQPRAVSITQATELGTCYTSGEIREIAELVHEHGLYLHLDGARLANAAAGLGCNLRELTTDAGVDILSFGATKNGALGAEAVVALRPGAAEDFRFLRKQGMQLPSKMRFVSAQLVALLSDGLWLRNAEHAGAMARRLAKGIREIPGVTVEHPVQANAVFATLVPEHIAELRKLWTFEVWDHARHQVRWMASFDTTAEDVDALLADIREVTGA